MTLVRIHSVPRGGDKTLVGRLGRVVGTESRKKKVLLEGGLTALLHPARLRPVVVEGPPPADPLAAAAFYWPHLWVSEDRLVPAPPPAQLAAEAAALKADFPGATVAFDYLGRVLEAAWTVGPVTLEGIKLGRFRATLKIVLGESEPSAELSVEALEPNPSKQNGRLTHPHVNDNYVCLGDGELAFNAAVDTGRLCDAALVVRSVLTHWSSEYCFSGGDLGEWNGYRCGNCNEVSGDSPGSCSECGEDACDGCGDASCHQCGSLVHGGCAVKCRCRRATCGACSYEIGDERGCADCTSKCDECNQRLFDSDLENGLCEGCQPERCEHCDTELEDGSCPSCEGDESPEEEEDTPSDGGVLTPVCFACETRPAYAGPTAGRCMPCHRRWILSAD
jgi:hypothetical protein